MTLRDGKKGHRYSVCSMELEQSTKMRLQALGLTDGTKIEVLNSKKSGSVIFNVRGTRLAIGKDIAECIEVAEIA
ncbi:MAG: ferrous iron transport protein A [Lachnospiraceae bacterium]|nr:ferrous iron transport protein A [Lachnospiraceae bacterium]